MRFMAVSKTAWMHGRAGHNRLINNTLVLLCKLIDYQWVSLLSPQVGDRITAQSDAGCKAAGHGQQAVCMAVPISIVHSARYRIVPRMFHAVQPALFHDCIAMFHDIYPPESQCFTICRHVNVTD